MKRHSLLLLVALVLPFVAISQVTASSWEPTPSGLLETFLSRTQNASINRKLLGGLGAPANPKATFTAIFAEDPSHPGVRVKGIEIEMETTTRKIKVSTSMTTTVQIRSVKVLETSLLASIG